MKNRITTSSYGFFIFSKSLFEEFLKEKKIRSKNLLSYFDKKKEIFNELCLERKIAIPMIKVSNYNYHLFVNEEAILGEDWCEVFHYKNFEINVGDDGLWMASFDFFENWNGRKKEFDTKETFIGYTIPTGVEDIPIFYNYALHFDVKKGINYFSIKGFRNNKANPKRLENDVLYEIKIQDIKEGSISKNILSADFNLDF